MSPLPGQPFEPSLWVFAIGRDLVGIFVCQLLEAEIAAACKLRRVCDRLRMVREQAGHFVRAFQMTLGIAREPEARFVDGARIADAGEDILKAAARGMMVEHIVRGDEGRAQFSGKGGEQAQPLCVVAMEAVCGGEIDAVLQPSRQILQVALKLFCLFRACKYIVRR